MTMKHTQDIKLNRVSISLPQKKMVSFQVVNAKTEITESTTETQIPHRRNSTASIPVLSKSIVPLEHNDANSAIPPPIPESLPTTPGYEFRGDDYFSNSSLASIIIPPTQQQQYPVVAKSEDDGDVIVQPADTGMTLSNPPNNKWRLISIILWSAANGAIDGAPGALLPRIEEYYNINYTIVSLIWMANAVGYICIASIAHKLEAWLNKRKLMTFGSLLQCLMFCLIAPGSKFGLVVFAFFFGGVGSAMGLSQHNIFISKFSKGSYYLGYYHGGYGIGATISPLIATAMVDSGVKWSYFYLILLGAVGTNFVNQWLAFKDCSDDLKPWDNWEAPSAMKEHNPTSSTDAINSQIDEPVVPKGDLHLALRNTRTWLVSLFVLFYQGSEVSMAGWIVTFLEDYRGGSKSSTGYIVSGFWGGLTLGRLILTPLVHKYIGGKRGVFMLIWTSIFCSILIWAIKVIKVEAVFVALCGLFVGPIYPLMISVSTRILPRKIQFISLTIMTAFGSSGGAIFPFIVGLVSQHAGAFVVMPFFIAMFTSTAVIWFLLPNPDRNIMKSLIQRVW